MVKFAVLVAAIWPETTNFGTRKIFDSGKRDRELLIGHYDFSAHCLLGILSFTEDYEGPLQGLGPVLK